MCVRVWVRRRVGIGKRTVNDPIWLEQKTPVKKQSGKVSEELGYKSVNNASSLRLFEQE